MGKKADVKGALKSAQSGTPIPSKDFSSKKTQDKADKPSSKGSMGKAASLPVPTATSTPVSTDKKWEGSSDDMMKDYSAAKRKGISSSEWEGSASDRLSDNAGERRMQAEDKKDGGKEVDHPAGYKAGIAAFQNSPKASHGFGHPTSAREGHLRNSGHSQAHRIGKRK